MTDRTLTRARVHAPGTVAAQPYDFESPELLGEAQRARLDAAFETWARAVAIQMTAKTRIVTRVLADPFVLTTLAAFRARFPPRQGCVVVGVQGVDRQAVYAVSTGAIVRWTSRLVGGRGLAPATERPLTTIERTLLWHLVDEHMHELVVALDGLVPPLSVEGATGSLAAVGDPDDLVVCARFAIEQAGGTVPLDLAIPAAPVLEAFGHGPAKQDPAGTRAALVHHVSSAPVQVALAFDETRVDPSFVLSLGEGSLIPLTHQAHRPLNLTVNGDPVLRAAAGANGERLACIVVGSEGGPA